MAEFSLINSPIAAAVDPTTANLTGTWRFERPVFVNRTAPCRAVCPLSVNMATVMDSIRTGEIQKAYTHTLWENPFPGLCGHICFAPCEPVCNRKRFDGALAVRALEGFVAGEACKYGWKAELPVIAKNVQVAVVGHGPAGWACAYFLARLGYCVTLFKDGTDIEEQVQRMVRDTGAVDLFQWELDQILDLGIDLHEYGSSEAQTYRHLAKSFAAVYFSGLHEHQTIKAPDGVSSTHLEPPYKGAPDISSIQLDENDILLLATTPKAAAGRKKPLPENRAFLEALADGKQAAMVIDMNLGRSTIDQVQTAFVKRGGRLSMEAYSQSISGKEPLISGSVVGYEDINRAHFEHSPPIDAPEPGKKLTIDQAKATAGRCFNCGSCNFCYRCYDYCPDLSVRMDKKNAYREIDYDHCKGCGICAAECPRGAVIMNEEKKA